MEFHLGSLCHHQTITLGRTRGGATGTVLTLNGRICIRTVSFHTLVGQTGRAAIGGGKQFGHGGHCNGSVNCRTPTVLVTVIGRGTPRRKNTLCRISAFGFHTDRCGRMGSACVGGAHSRHAAFITKRLIRQSLCDTFLLGGDRPAHGRASHAGYDTAFSAFVTRRSAYVRALYRSAKHRSYGFKLQSFRLTWRVSETAGEFDYRPSAQVIPSNTLLEGSGNF